MIENMPKISVIVPVYNVEKYLNRCVDSILAQSFTNFELILVDDGSTDGSGKICDDYLNRDMRIKVFHKPNGGVSAARNSGLELAVGDYIMFVDSDDYIDKDFLKNAIEKVGDNDWFISGIFMYGNGNEEKYAPKFERVYTIKDLYENVFKEIPQICLCGPWCKLYKVNYIKENNILFNPKLRCGEDTDFNLSYAEHVKSVYVDKNCYYNYYRGNTNSLFSSYNEQYYEDHVTVGDKWLQLLENLQCSQETIIKYRQMYMQALIANINMCFNFKKPYKEKRKIIRTLSYDKTINSSVKLTGKNEVIRKLLKHKMKFSVYCIYWLHYCKKV